MSEGGLKAIKAIVGGVALVLLVITVARWYGDYRISTTDSVLENAVTPPQGEGSEAPAGSNGGETSTPDSGSEEAPAAKTVVVLTDGLNFREEPKKDGTVIRGLDEGEKLVLIKEENGWYQVKTSEGTEGWITASPSYSKVE